MQLLQYHKGPFLSGKISVNLIWYCKFKPSQRAIPNGGEPQKTITILLILRTPFLSLGKQVLLENYSLGKSLTQKQTVQSASKGEQKKAINVVLTASDVAVDGFCRQCPGYFAWPFHQPIYGLQSPPLGASNNDVGIDGMVINLASLLARNATNPFGNGYYQGEADAPLDAASACPSVYAKGAYPGYAGDLLVDKTTGASYNAHGTNGRKYLVPALYDPATSSCSTLV
ncbi:unnamed protein product [Withania somnifera]